PRGGHHRPARDGPVAGGRGRRRAHPRGVEVAVMTLRLVWPLWVIAVIFLPLLLVSVLAAVRARRSGDGTFAAWLRRGGMVLALLAIALGPAVPSTTTTVATNVEVFFVVDRTGSMAAEDYDGDQPRLE